MSTPAAAIDIEQILETQHARRSPAKPASRLQPLAAHSGLEVYHSEFAEPEPIIDRLLFPGLTIFVARPKVGKSWLALQIAVALTKSTLLAGCLRVRKTGKVLYLALEESQARTAPRLRKLTGPSDFLEDIHFCYAAQPLQAGGVEQIDAFLQQTPCTLVVIDTFFAFAKAAGRRDVDLLQDDYNKINSLRELCQRHGCAMLLIHHARKAEGDGVDVVLGTSGISAACDAIWALRRNIQGEHLLTVRGREMEEVVYGMKFEDGDHFGWRITGSGEEAMLSAERREIVKLLRSEGPQVPKRIAAMLGNKNANTVRRLLQKLVADGLIAKNGETYSLTQQGANE